MTHHRSAFMAAGLIHVALGIATFVLILENETGFGLVTGLLAALGALTLARWAKSSAT
jgi:hypothetical protein